MVLNKLRIISTTDRTYVGTNEASYPKPITGRRGIIWKAFGNYKNVKKWTTYRWVSSSRCRHMKHYSDSVAAKSDETERELFCREIRFEALARNACRTRGRLRSSGVASPGIDTRGSTHATRASQVETDFRIWTHGSLAVDGIAECDRSRRNSTYKSFGHRRGHGTQTIRSGVAAGLPVFSARGRIVVRLNQTIKRLSRAHPHTRARVNTPYCGRPAYE